MRCSSVFLMLLISFVLAKAAPIITQIGDFSYMIWHDSKLTWEEAFKFCEEQNMKLLSLENKIKNEGLKEYLIKQDLIYKPGKGSDYIFWTSGKFVKGENKFKWEGINQDFTASKWLNWLPGMPDNWRNDEYCVEFGLKEVGKWNDDRCWYHRHFICERNKKEDTH